MPELTFDDVKNELIKTAISFGKPNDTATGDLIQFYLDDLQTPRFRLTPKLCLMAIQETRFREFKPDTTKYKTSEHHKYFPRVQEIIEIANMFREIRVVWIKLVNLTKKYGVDNDYTFDDGILCNILKDGIEKVLKAGFYPFAVAYGKLLNHYRDTEEKPPLKIIIGNHESENYRWIEVKENEVIVWSGFKGIPKYTGIEQKMDIDKLIEGIKRIKSD